MDHLAHMQSLPHQTYTVLSPTSKKSTFLNLLLVGVKRLNLMNMVVCSFFLNLDTPEKLTGDWEIQNWGHMLADPEDGLGIKVEIYLPLTDWPASCCSKLLPDCFIGWLVDWLLARPTEVDWQFDQLNDFFCQGSLINRISWCMLGSNWVRLHVFIPREYSEMASLQCWRIWSKPWPPLSSSVALGIQLQILPSMMNMPSHPTTLLSCEENLRRTR